jgi:hypothetical protein
MSENTVYQALSALGGQRITSGLPVYSGKIAKMASLNTSPVSRSRLTLLPLTACVCQIEVVIAIGITYSSSS